MSSETRHIFITGGVASSLGKGLTSASIAMLLEARGLRVGMQKFDPYINVDPGTMSPFQHGEVYVTADGAETDLDLGHYERFTTKAVLGRHSNVTTGRIYNSVISRERRGNYLGETVQVIPHVTNEIKATIKLAARDCDVCLHEIGGTVGDIESLPFLEAIRQYAYDVGRKRCMHLHLTLVPYLRAAGELKTKPTQHSVQQLRQIGIRPDVLICRTERPLSQEIKDKIALFCDVDRDAVIEEKDVEVSIYEVPLVLRKQGLDDLICSRLGFPDAEPSLSTWEDMLDRVRNPTTSTEIAVVGKYIELHDAYKSIYESMVHAGIWHSSRVHFRKVSAEEVLRRGAAATLMGARGVLVPGGFGERGIEGKILAAQYARERKVPFLGICLGLQCAVIEAARNLCGLEHANSSEFDAETPDPVISLLEEQRTVEDKGGTMRLGSYACRLTPGTRAALAYGDVEEVSERHRHRYEFNNAYRKTLEAVGFVVSGTNVERNLAEILEYRDHPWYMGVQFHPEFQSKPTAPHPLFRDFIGASLKVEAAQEIAQ